MVGLVAVMSRQQLSEKKTRAGHRGLSYRPIGCNVGLEEHRIGDLITIERYPG
jgi:hypothetical protein